MRQETRGPFLDGCDLALAQLSVDILLAQVAKVLVGGVASSKAVDLKGLAGGLRRRRGFTYPVNCGVMEVNTRRGPTTPIIGENLFQLFSGVRQRRTSPRTRGRCGLWPRNGNRSAARLAFRR